MVAVANAGFASEKKSIHAAERDTEANRQLRAAYLERLSQIAPERLIYLDESGVSTQMTRRFGRVEGARRLREAVPAGNWKTLTLLGALSTTGVVAAMTVEAATDREVFLTYLDEVLCPKLKAGDVVVMDNLSTHKAQEVRQRIEDAKAELLYLPPTRRISTPSKRHGPNSNISSETASHAPSTLSTRPSKHYSHKSQTIMQKLGSDSDSESHSKCENDLEGRSRTLRFPALRSVA